MALTQYCEFDEVRAALGANALELSDAVLSLPIYEIGLTRELAKISASLPAAFLLLRESAALTDAQSLVVNSVRLFSAYAVAKQAGVPLGNMIPKDVSDGKASLSRFSDSPYKDVLERVSAAYAEARADLASAYAALTAQTTPNVLIAPAVLRRSPRGFDPVTNT